MKNIQGFRTLLLFCIFVLSVIFTPDMFLDLYRYYEEANSMNIAAPIKQIYENYMSASSDFIYYLTLYVCRLMHLPIQLVNGFYVTLFYYSAFLILEDYAGEGNYLALKAMKMAMLSMVFAMPVLFVFSIARMTASFSFIFLAVHYMIKRKWIQSVILLVIALFTHTGSAIYMFFLGSAVMIGLILNRRPFLSYKPVGVVIFMSSVLVFFLEKGISLVLQLPFFNTYHYFALYLQNLRMASFDGLGGITTLTLLFYYFCIFLFATKSKLNFPYNAAVALVPFLVMSFVMSDMFLQRTSMFLIPAFGVMMLSSYKRIYNMQILLTTIAIFLGIFCILATNRFYI